MLTVIAIMRRLVQSQKVHSSMIFMNKALVETAESNSTQLLPDALEGLLNWLEQPVTACRCGVLRQACTAFLYREQPIDAVVEDPDCDDCRTVSQALRTALQRDPDSLGMLWDQMRDGNALAAKLSTFLPMATEATQ